ncbi:MAG: FtsW/RodA/SpoVE family cell cycle protein [Leptospiraceae bacterium]|nr:FtsW/RodA/SpoVE family cell cycle protein [Leptospiraceae bacterium]MCP5511195.1 FtsW/RodA/SpoVE family cell cycle protein [Leptospiraceae bacterium]
MESNQDNYFKDFWKIGKNSFDHPLVYLVIILLFLGLGVLISAGTITSQREYEDAFFLFKKQAVWAGFGFLFFLVAINVPVQFYWKNSQILFLLSIVSLTLVFIPGIGRSVETYYGRNFHRWINLGFIQFQPSEFAKISTVLYVSSVLVRYKTEDNHHSYSFLVTPAAFVALLLLLVVAEPAFGTTLEILFIILTLIFINGFPLKKLIIGLIAMTPLLFLLVYKVGYRKKRIDVWLDPYKYRFDEGHQLVSSFRSFMEGGFLGNPLSTGYSHRYLTYSHTDFILSTYVEDYGYLGFLFLLGLFLLLITRTYILLKNVNNLFALHVGTGLISMISLQIIMNTFVVTGIIPITGISLPFLSYGGSSLITILISMGIILNITKRENLY